MLTDNDFLKAFESCELPEERWTHDAHVRMAWLYLRRWEIPEALAIIRAGITRYNASLSKPLAYHETITRGYVTLIAQAMAATPTTTFAEFCRQCPELLDGTLSALLRHYRPETLFSEPARHAFVEPNLLPFD